MSLRIENRNRILKKFLFLKEDEMASNRLFIFDPESNSAVCIGKGYSSSWSSSLKPFLDKWLNEIPPEFTGSIKQTRLQLKTEYDLPKDSEITWQTYTYVEKSLIYFSGMKAHFNYFWRKFYT